MKSHFTDTIEFTKYLMRNLHILVTQILRPTYGNCNEKPTAKMRGFLVPFTDIIGGTRGECIGKMIVVVATFNHNLLLSTGAPRQIVELSKGDMWSSVLDISNIKGLKAKFHHTYYTKYGV